jgi:hypothetical protein
MRSECTHGVIGYRLSAIRSELQASLPVYLVRSARTVWSSVPLLDNWNHSKVQQAIATSAEAAKTKIAIHSNLLSRGEATSAQTFHKRVSGSASTVGRVSDDCSVANLSGPKILRGGWSKVTRPIGSQTSFETDLSGNCGVAHVLSPENSYDSVSNTAWTMTGAPMGGL